jgi:ATP-dependent Clp protease adaptor protein ClpS
VLCHHGGVTTASPVEVDPGVEEDLTPEEITLADTPWVTVVWNDPVNLMSYVTYVFQTVFGFAREKAEKLMLDVHHKGRAVVDSGTREEMERNVEVLHSYGLWATVKRDD